MSESSDSIARADPHHAAAARDGRVARKLVDRLIEKTKASEELSRKLADDGAALGEARAELAESLRDFTIAEASP